MAGQGRITLSGAELSAAEADCIAAADTLSAAAPALRSAIPADAFGALGGGIAAAGNSLGTAAGVALEKLARLARESGQGARRIRVAVDELEQSASDSFTQLRAEVDG